MLVIIILLFFFLLYLFLIFPRTSEQERMQKWHSRMFAHRGLHNITEGIPENSMPAFRAAIENGYGIELDLHITSDGQIVVFHDDTLNRMCGITGTIEHMSYTELRGLCLKGTPEHIPLFKDVLTLVDGKVPLLIEFKLPTKSASVCEKAYEYLKNYEGEYLVQSFNTMGVRWFKLHAPHVLRGQLASRLTKENGSEPWILKFAVQNLLCNFVGRPDFISYKLTDLPQLSVSILQHILHTPIAVWTLNTEKKLHTGIKKYDMQIFEKQIKILNK